MKATYNNKTVNGDSKGQCLFLMKELLGYFDSEENVIILGEVDENLVVYSYTSDEYSSAIETHIYSNYPQSKQSSDTADKMYFETILSASGVENLEAIVVSKIKMIQDDGKTVEEAVADLVEEMKLGVSQLVKVGIRVAWVMACKAEYHLAVAEGREMNLPAFPNI